jgi:hypothetical protein
MAALQFTQAWQRRVKGELFGIKVWFVSLLDLIHLKEKAARPQDKLDVIMLKKHRQ